MHLIACAPLCLQYVRIPASIYVLSKVANVILAGVRIWTIYLMSVAPNEFASLLSPANPVPPDYPQISLGVLASGSGSNFEAIAQAIEAKTLNAQVQVVIYNNPGAKVVERAKRWHIPAILLDHRTFPSREALDTAIIEVLKAHQVDWVIMAGWMRVVTSVLIEAFPQHILNIHPSLLPSFPGTHAIEQAFNAGVKITGCTVHHVELTVDSGPIIAQAAVPILPGDSVEQLQARIQIQEHRLYPLAIGLAATANPGGDVSK
jgi:phosphoribosylglycinamide formyltransferase 1